MQEVKYLSHKRLECIECLPSDVVLCIPVSLDANAVEGSTTGITYASLTHVSKTPHYYIYTFEYDEAQVTQNLLTEDIKGVFCENCQTDWTQEIIIRGWSTLNNLEPVVVESGDVQSSYTPLNFLDSEGIAKSISIYNNLNQDVQISYGGVDDGPIIPLGSFLQLNFASNWTILSASDIYLRYINSDAPTLGEFIIEGYY